MVTGGFKIGNVRRNGFLSKDDRIERGTGNGKYTQWTKDLGERLHLPVLDLTNLCADLYEKLGREKVNAFYSDHNHTYVPGADFVAGMGICRPKARFPLRSCKIIRKGDDIRPLYTAS